MPPLNPSVPPEVTVVPADVLPNAPRVAVALPAATTSVPPLFTVVVPVYELALLVRLVLPAPLATVSPPEPETKPLRITAFAAVLELVVSRNPPLLIAPLTVRLPLAVVHD